MQANRLIRSGLLAVGLLVASSLTGCTGPIEGLLAPNQRPSIELTQAPVNTDGEYFYAYRINWSANDPDGQVLYYEYAIDPPTTLQTTAGRETLWVRTERQEQTFFFRASIPIPSGTAADTARDFHVFAIRAVDNSGNVETMRSAIKSRAFFSYTVAPTVRILRPNPSRLLQPFVTPSVRISWQGSDPDGQFTQKPVKYKYRLFRPGDVPSIQTFTLDPDSLRRLFGPGYFADWDSTSAETTSVQFTNLTPTQQYLFVVVAFDEAGAYSPEFNLDTNMLLFNVDFAGTRGPQFNVFNSFFFYRYPSGGYTTDPRWVIKLEAAAGVPFDCAWFAEPPEGSLMEWYRWGVDLADLTDETPRTNEQTDWYHWSQKSPTNNSCRIGPFPGDRHTIYIEGQDNNGLRSLAIVEVQFVGAPLNRELLIVDDTRLTSDQLLTTSDPTGARCIKSYTGSWPAAAELDTFLYARGGVMWRGLAANCPVIPPSPVLSTPGVFAGYSYDTLNTRQGFLQVSNSVPLSKLGQYARIIWMVDGDGAQNTEPVSPVRPMTALRFMSAIGRANTLAAYANLGGEIWLLGGAAGYASLISFNRTVNDQGLLGTLFSSVPVAGFTELLPTRMMFDFFHWRSEFITGRSQNRVVKSEAARGGWSHPNRDNTAIINAPNYALLPQEMRRKSAATDAVPASRPPGTTSAFYLTSLPLEYLTQQNFIIEDVDPDPDDVSERSTLDTLFALDNFADNLYPFGNTNPRPVMTYYHGSDSAPMVFSGFNIWNFAREDCIRLVDFVLQEIWGLPREQIDRQPGFAARSAAPSPITTPAQEALRSRLPVGGKRGD